MPTAPASPLVAVDANVLMDLAEGSESVIEALETIRQRLFSPRIVIPPTAKLELVHIARHGDTDRERKLALNGIAAARRWRIIPVNLMPVGHGIVERVAEKLRTADLIPARGLALEPLEKAAQPRALAGGTDSQPVALAIPAGPAGRDA